MARGPKIPRFGSKALCGISHRFQWLSPSKRQIPKCYSPVRRSSSSSKLEMLPLDLHVLSLPPAFNLSHDQTLQLKVLDAKCFISLQNKAAQLYEFLVTYI